ncbi:MAG: AAA family ATPase [Hydrogenophilaceae bacterium]|nr:AAA family ATPase [Hydrogenophilaceae bacterium]
METPALIAALLKPDAYPHAVGAVRLIETHISWVLIAGDFAYKLKKPLDLGFLDFSTLEKRRHFCDEEIRLNRRLAPEIYLDVVAVTGSESAPRIDGDGPVLDWAVRMRAFPPDATLDWATELTTDQIDAIADALARFHRDLPPAPAASTYGGTSAVLQPALENFAQIRALSPTLATRTILDRLDAWTRQEGERLAPAFAERRDTGFIRECHGDLHLGNIAWVADAPLIFDCIEFNPALRWIDVLSELAFLFMDLVHRERTDLAWRLLNRYLEHTGDYAGLPVFRFYLVYRAMVRAKVAAIRAHQQPNAGDSELLGYLALAERLSRPLPAALMLMHGVSGSGKTWLAQQVLERLGAVRLRSDVERKRLFGLTALEDSRRIEGGIYTEAASARTFQRLLDLAHQLLLAGYAVIVDATFLKQAHRAPFVQLAGELQVPLRILSLQADATLLRQRVRQRLAEAHDASEADLTVLEMQLQGIEPFTEAESKQVVVFRADESAEWLRRIPGLLEGMPETAF